MPWIVNPFFSQSAKYARERGFIRNQRRRNKERKEREENALRAARLTGSGPLCSKVAFYAHSGATSSAGPCAPVMTASSRPNRGKGGLQSATDSAAVWQGGLAGSASFSTPGEVASTDFVADSTGIVEDVRKTKQSRQRTGFVRSLFRIAARIIGL
jgi:hypothetical protein